MKIGIFGAGAIGGMMAVLLTKNTAAQVSVVGRGPQLDAIRRNGLVLHADGVESRVRVPSSANAADFGVQDVVIVAVKTCGLAAALPGLAPLVGANTIVVPAMNGVPWWFMNGFGGPLQGMRLEGADPGGVIEAALPVQSVVGCVVYPAAYVAEPGVVRHTGRWDLHFGEAAGSPGERSAMLATLFRQAGFNARRADDIRREIWAKLIGNASLNPVAALTQATLDRMLDDPDVYSLLRGLMREIIAVGAALGLHTGQDPDQRLHSGRVLGATKLSMLQDLEAGRAMEHESLSGAVLAIAARLGLETPLTQAVQGMIRQRARGMGQPANRPA